MQPRSLRKKLTAAVMAGVSVTVFSAAALTPVRAEASVAGSLIGTAISAGVAYKQMETSIKHYNATEEGRQELLAGYKEKYGVVENSPYAGMTDRVMSRLTKAIGSTDPTIYQKPYLYFINKQTTFNAFCSMGHVMSINQGLFDLVDNEDEVAVVLGHEMGHGQKDHVAKSARKRLVAAVGVSAIGAAAGGGYLNNLVLNALMNNIDSLHITKPGEWEADNLAFDYILAAGYNPGACAAIWQRVTEKYGTNKSSFVGDIFSPSDHPSHKQRIENYVKKLHAMSGKHATVDKGVVKVNGKKFVETVASGGMSGPERSYFVLGNLAAAYKNGHNKSDAYASGSTVMLGDQPILTCASGDGSASELAALLNKIK